jgi:hypothetical protein
MKKRFEGDNFYCEIVYEVEFEQYTVALYRKSDHCLVLEVYCAKEEDATYTAKRVWTNAETFKAYF